MPQKRHCDIGKRRWDNIQHRHDIREQLGEGGNACVYRCKGQVDGEKYALKVLTKKSHEKTARFLEEIEVMTTWGQKISGILPIIDSSTDDFWYTMPVATPVMETIKAWSEDTPYKTRYIVSGIREVAQTLIGLHANSVSHRDIKPANIYWYDGRFTLGDFGLVDLPDSPEDLTQSNRPLGAIFTMAPEMKRNPQTADGCKADVYSLAKTLWMLLVEDETGFEGKYDWRDERHALTNFGGLKQIHLVGIEELLQTATSNDPDARPTMRDFDKALADWEKTEKSETLSQKSEWDFLAKYMFGDQVPRTAVYEKKTDIVAILNMIGKRHAYNYMFVPSRGGDDFSRVEPAEESGCIYIRTNLSGLILNPKKLWVETFPGNAWNYFLLETHKLSPVSGIEAASGCQDLVEDLPGHYVSARYAPYGVYDYDTGNPYPTGWRSVTRYTGGNFLIVPKFGPYNRIGETDDARHNDVPPAKFRKYIERLSAGFESYCLEGHSPYRILRTDTFRKNPFRAPPPAPRLVSSGTSAREFFREKYAALDFRHLIPTKPSGCRDGFDYYICFPYHLDSLPSLWDAQRGLYLMANGRLEIHDGLPGAAFIVHCRDEALEILWRVKRCLRTVCTKNGVMQSPEWSGRVEWVRKDKPTHLFTKQELECLLRAADDRRNNRLVVDGEGFFRLVAPRTCICPYPVSFETFCHATRNVGRYSTWTPGQYTEWYQTALRLWLTHLETGRSVSADYVQKADAQALIAQISRFY